MSEATKKTAETAGKDLAESKRRNIAQFGREVWREGIEKVTWPSWKETYLTTVMVFIMVGITMMFFFAVDWILAMGERWLIGATG